MKGDVSIHCTVPVDGDARERLLGEMADALAGCPGPWMVDLTEVEGQGWWALRVQGGGFRWVTTFHSRQEQDPASVGARLRTAMQVALLQRELARKKRRA